MYNDQNKYILVSNRFDDNCYTFDSMSCLKTTNNDDSLNWHRRLGRMNHYDLIRLSKIVTVRGLPKLSKELTQCERCQLNEQRRQSHKKMQNLNTSRVLELQHMDLMGPMNIASIKWKKVYHCLLDDCSRCTWVDFLKEKLDTFQALEKLCNQLAIEKDETTSKIIKIHNDHGKEFKNHPSVQYYC